MGGTYGGNAVACAAGVATIAAMEEEGMLANAARQGEKFRAYFEGKMAQYPCIGEVRGKGLMMAIECVQPGGKEPNTAAAKAFIAECVKRRLIVMGPARTATASACCRRSTSAMPTSTSPSASSTRPPRWRSPEPRLAATTEPAGDGPGRRGAPARRRLAPRPVRPLRQPCYTLAR